MGSTFGYNGSMKYKPRKVFIDLHTTPWKRAIMVCHRRAGKSYSMAAEMLKRAYNGPSDGQYVWLSPMGEQSILNVQNIFRTLDDQGYIVKFDKTDGIMTLANGAQIQLGGDRTAEKIRGRYLDGAVLDEASQLKPETWSEIISYALADRNGWAAFIGTARSDDGYRLYNMYKQWSKNPNWFSKMVGVLDNPEAFPPERVQEIKEEHINFCLNAGMSMEQALQSFNVEFLCDFSFIDEGKPDMSALFYNELQSIFMAEPPRLLDPAHPTIQEGTRSEVKVAVFDIGHSTGRDYTSVVFASETSTAPVVHAIEWENNQPLGYWFNRLRILGYNTVALPFDAATVNKETLLSLFQTFKREGFNVIKFKRLQRTEQIENGRWLLTNAVFSRDAVPGLSELGKFREFKTKHGLEQDIASAILYAGQVLRKKHVRFELANTIKTRYKNNSGLYHTGVSFYGGITGV